MVGALTPWLLAARPKTLPAAIAPVLIGTAMAYRDGGFHLLAAAAALVGAVLIQVGTNYANDYLDFHRGTDTEDRLGPTRVTQAGLVSPGAIRNATVVVFTLALVVGIYLVYRGGWPIVIIGLLSIASGLLYTAGPYPLAYVGLADVFVLVFFGPVAVGGTYYVQTLHITPAVIVAGLAPGLFSVAILSVNNLRDIESDRRANKKTLAVRFGEQFARAEFLIAVIVASAIPVYMYVFHDGPALAMVATIELLIAIPVARSALTETGRVLNDVLAGTGRLLFLYSLLFSVGWIL
jgi:1,4-dihydroxy-2-naphthoate octaprenyltransferase